MTGRLTKLLCFLLAALSPAAAPPSKPVDPEPPGPVYHRFYVHVDMPERSDADLRKVLAPLQLARADLTRTAARYRKIFKKEPSCLRYNIYIRSRKPYDKVLAELKAKPGVQRVAPPAPAFGKRTVDRLPVQKLLIGIPFGQPKPR